MIKLDAGFGMQDTAEINDKVPQVVLQPESRILDPVSIERMRWRCRRGLLELDIVLGRFIEHYSDLDENQRIVFDTLLDLPDTTLWDMLSGKVSVQQQDQLDLITLINKA